MKPKKCRTDRTQRPKLCKEKTKNLLLKFFLLLPPLCALILEALPYGAVLIFKVQTEDGNFETIRVLSSYFDPTNYGYANFGPLIAAVLTCAIILCAVLYFFIPKAATPLKIVSVAACVASLLPLLFGLEYFSAFGTAISILLGVESVFAFLFASPHPVKTNQPNPPMIS